MIGTVVRAIDSEAKLVCSIPTKNSHTEVKMRVSNLSFVCGFKPGDIVYTNRSIINTQTKQELLKKNRKGWVIGSAQKNNGRVVCLFGAVKNGQERKLLLAPVWLCKSDSGNDAKEDDACAVQ